MSHTAVEEYRGHRVGAHRYKVLSASGDPLWAVHVNGVLAGSQLDSADIAMRIGRNRVDDMLKEAR